ncbi:Androgen-binding protein-like protein, partial [Heterocephalus glaber]
MRGTVLVLALLLTAELRIQPVEACVIFYDVFTRVILGSKEPLFDVLAKVNATEGEKAAFQKIQQCFNEGGLKAKIVDTFAMVTSSLIP